MVLDKKKECKIIDFAVPRCQNLKCKKHEKVLKHQYLRIEIERFWNVKVLAVLLVVGAIEAVSGELVKNLGQLEISLVVPCLPKAILIGTAFILRRVICFSEYR